MTNDLEIAYWQSYAFGEAKKSLHEVTVQLFTELFLIAYAKL